MARKKKDFTGDPGGLIGDATFSVIKPIYREGEKRRKERTRAPRTRRYYEPAPRFSQKEMVFEVLPEAIRNAGTLYSTRDLYYAVRPLAYAHSWWSFTRSNTLDYGYFSQALLTEYQEWHGELEGLWRDPRGHLHEPHTDRVVPLGTREVAAYQFPEYTFDKVLYVEKEGEMPKLQEAKLAERYDMASVSGKGYPAEAVRTLFEQAEGGDYQLFVFHDADLDGYNIARVLRQATRRMPGYSVDVVDIGLTDEDALEMGLDSEPFYRKKDISNALYCTLSERAKEYLYQRDGYSRGVRGERFELNAILPSSARIEYIERKLAECGVRGKVIPPEARLGKLAARMYREQHDSYVEKLVAELFLDAVKEDLATKFKQHYPTEAPEAREQIEAVFGKDRTPSWREALRDRFEATRGEHANELREAIREAVRERLLEP